MERRESVNCQNCVALSKKLELFQLLKQQCSKTDDVAKNLLLMKKYCEKSARNLEIKTRKLTEIRSKLRDVEQSEETLRRKFADYQLRLVSADTKFQDLLKEYEREKITFTTLSKEKQQLDDLVLQKSNEVTCLIITSKQSAEQYLVETDKLKTNIQNLEDTVQKWKLRNQNLMKAKVSFQNKYSKLSSTLLKIFKNDEVVINAESLTQLKRAVSRLRSQANAAKLEADLSTPSMTPDGTASSDTGIFSGDEDVGSPCLDDDLQISSDSSDDEFENVHSAALDHKITLSSKTQLCETRSISQMCTESSKPKSFSPSLSVDFNSSNEYFGEEDNTLTPSLIDPIPGNNETNLRIPIGSSSGGSPPELPYSTLNTESIVTNSIVSPQESPRPALITVGGSIFDIPPSDSTDCRLPAKCVSKSDTNYKGVSFESPPQSPVKNSLNEEDLMDGSTQSKRMEGLASPVKSSVKTTACDESQLGPVSKLADACKQDGLSRNSPAKEHSKLIFDADINLPDLSLEKKGLRGSSSPIKSPVMDDSETQRCSQAIDESQQAHSLNPTASEAMGDLLDVQGNCSNSENDCAINSYCDSQMSEGATHLTSEDEAATDILDPNMSDAEKDLESDDADEDLDSMFKEWAPPTPVMPFSEDSTSIDGGITLNEPGSGHSSMVAAIRPFSDLQKSSLCNYEKKTENQHCSAILTISVGTNTERPTSTNFECPTCPKKSQMWVAPLKISVGTSTEPWDLTNVSKGFSILVEEHEKEPSICCADIATSPMKELSRSVSTSPIKTKNIDKEKGPAELEMEVETSSNTPSLIDQAASPVKVSCASVGVMPVEEFWKNAGVSPMRNETADAATSPVKDLFRSISTSPIKSKNKELSRETSPDTPEMVVETSSNILSSVDQAVSPFRTVCADVSVMPIEEFWKNASSSPIRTKIVSVTTSPVKCLYKDVSVSPYKCIMSDKETSPIELEVSTSSIVNRSGQEMCEFISSSHFRSISPLAGENYVPGCYKEAKMLQKAVKVLGINPEYLEAVTLDKTVVVEVRRAMEMALKKASQLHMFSNDETAPIQKLGTPSFCSFVPCEFAELCNQQHYNLHLLAKSKNLEKTMCMFGKTNKQKIKRLNVHSKKRRKNKHLSLSFKEELIEDDISNDTKSILSSTSCGAVGTEESGNNIEGTPTLRKETTSGELHGAAESSLEMELHETAGAESTNVTPLYSNGFFHSRTDIGHTSERPGDDNSTTLKALGPMDTSSAIVSQLSSKISQRPLEASIFADQVEKTHVNSIPSPARDNSISFSAEQSTAEEYRISSIEAATPSMVIGSDNQLCSKSLNIEDSGSELNEHLCRDQVTNDEGFDDDGELVISEDLCDGTGDTSKNQSNSLQHGDPVPETKPVKRVRGKRQSTSSESSSVDSTTTKFTKVEPLRRSPRTKKVRVAHDRNSGSKTPHQQGYIKFVKGGTAFVNSEPEQKDDFCYRPIETRSSTHTLPPAERVEVVAAAPNCNIMEHANFPPDKTVFKRGAPNDLKNESNSKRPKLSTPQEFSKERINGDSTTLKIGGNANEECVVGSGLGENQLPKKGKEKGNYSVDSSNHGLRSKCVSRKLSKLQKMRSSVSKVHPLTQVSKPVKDFEEREVVESSFASSRLNIPAASNSPKSNSSLSSQDEAQHERLKSEAEIIEKLKGKECVRMAAAASGRVAQLIDVKCTGARRQKHTASQPSGVPKIFASKATHLQPLVRPEDRISAVTHYRGISRRSGASPTASNVSDIATPEIPIQPFASLEDQKCEVSNAANSDQSVTQQMTPEHVPRSTSDAVVPPAPTVTSFLIPNNSNKLVTGMKPLAYSLSQNSSQKINLATSDLKCTEQLVQEALKHFIAAPSFTPGILEKAVSVLSSNDSDHVLPVIVRDIVKIVNDDHDTPLASFGRMRTNSPPLTPVQQQLLTLIIQLARQHRRFDQLPSQVLRLLEYKMFRLGRTPENSPLMWCTRLYAAICRALCLRKQALIFCWDALYTLRVKSYCVIHTVLDVWPYLFPIHPSFEKACPNAQVMVHLLRSHIESDEEQQRKFNKGWLKLFLNSPALKAPGINSSILASKIFSNVIGGGSDVNVAALVLLAKREVEQWALKDVVTGKLLPALERWRNKHLDDVAGERVIWTLCSILRALPPERNGTTAHSVLGLLKSELSQKSISYHMQEVISMGLVLLSRHDVESAAVALMSWNPDHGTSTGYSPRLLQYLSSLIECGSRQLNWWKGRLNKTSLETSPNQEL